MLKYIFFKAYIFLPTITMFKEIIDRGVLSSNIKGVNFVTSDEKDKNTN